MHVRCDQFCVRVMVEDSVTMATRIGTCTETVSTTSTGALEHRPKENYNYKRREG